MSECVPDRTRAGIRACVIAALLGLLFSGLAHAEPALADPTRPPLTRVGPKLEQKIEKRAPLTLSAVFFAEDHRSAIVNGERVGKGDVVQGARVIEIELGRVVLIRDDARIELPLVGDVKRPRRTDAESDPANERTEETLRVPAAPREGSPS